MSINIIAMLTNNDKTVENALDLFIKNKDAKTNCWGFKDIGANSEQIEKLANEIKNSGKDLFFEPLAEDEEVCFNAANVAIKYNFDYLIGMKFIPEINDLLQKNGIKYFPTCGRRGGIPRMLFGSVDEILEDADKIASYGVDGLCLSTYRYKDGNPEDLAVKFINDLNIPIIISGGINGFQRLSFIKQMIPWGFTIGSAFFDQSFDVEATISEKVNLMQDFLLV